MRGATWELAEIDYVAGIFQSTLLMRGATTLSTFGGCGARFQSTLLMRGATTSIQPKWHSSTDFNPRSSCEERLASGLRLPSTNISIHAPHARSDISSQMLLRLAIYFNPRSSCEERRIKSMCGDWQEHFNPRSSCEERQLLQEVINYFVIFQSTLLMRGATWRRRRWFVSLYISIHAPHARSDTDEAARRAQRYQFQSTLLMRGATADSNVDFLRTNFNPRSSCEERLQGSSLRRRGSRLYFNPRSSCEERHGRQV